MATENTNFSSEEIGEIFEKSKKIFFIGINGISMSSLATFCLYSGKEIYGYDAFRGNNSKKLEGVARIHYYSTPDSVSNMDLVIYSCAIDKSNFEYKQAKKLQIPTISRANFLFFVSSKYKNKIGISATHGKSTTTSLLARCFDYAHLSPTVFCGARMQGYDSAFLWGKRDYFICEACEYMDSFLSLELDICGIINIELDHLDYFKDENMLLNSFFALASKSKSLVVGIDTPLSRKVAVANKQKAKTFSLYDKSADYFARETKTGFKLFKGKKEVVSSHLNFRGTHFVENSACASIIALESGISPLCIESALKESYGVAGRLEFIKKTDTGAHIFKDYAHHPTEIKSTFDALKKMGYKKVACFFQPHTFSRTFYLLDNFKEALCLADTLYILPTYKAREENIYGVDENTLASLCSATVIYSFKNFYQIVSDTRCDCAVIMGAGDFCDLEKYL